VGKAVSQRTTGQKRKCENIPARLELDLKTYTAKVLLEITELPNNRELVK